MDQGKDLGHGRRGQAHGLGVEVDATAPPGLGLDEVILLAQPPQIAQHRAARDADPARQRADGAAAGTAKGTEERRRPARHWLRCRGGLGARPGQVVSLVVYVVDHDMGKLGVLPKAVVAMFGDRPPAQTLVPVPKLAVAVDGMLFEVKAVAVL